MTAYYIHAKATTHRRDLESELKREQDDVAFVPHAATYGLRSSAGN